jgi:hypothetical protein
MRSGVYIAGSGKDAGKTTLCLGLAARFDSMLPKGASFIKPLGQKISMVNGDSIGQDSWFISRALNLRIPPGNSAVMLASRGAAQRFIETGEPQGIAETVKKSYRYLQRNSSIVLVEGTGHPGVGSVFEMDNARVAALLGTPVILVIDGGIGKTIDSFSLCSALFSSRSVPLLGVVVNRVLPGKMESVSSTLRKWFGERGIPVFGIIPFEDRIARPSIATITRAIDAFPSFAPEKVGEISGAGFITAFESPDEVLEKVRCNRDKALLVSASRPGVMDAVIVSRISGGPSPSALVVCGGQPDNRRTLACEAAAIPLYSTEYSLEGSAVKLAGGLFKTEPDEEGKIASIIDMISREVDAEGILTALSSADGATRKEPRKGIIGFFRRVFRRG